MVGLPVAVFLHNRFSGFRFSFLSSSPFPNDRWWPRSAPRPPTSSLPCLYLPDRFHPPLPLPYTLLPALGAHLVGGCILITFMSSDIPARFIALTPADSSDHPPLPTHLSNHPPPSPSFLSFLYSLLPSFLWKSLKFSLCFSVYSSLCLGKFCFFKIFLEFLFIQLFF